MIVKVLMMRDKLGSQGGWKPVGGRSLSDHTQSLLLNIYSWN